MDHIKITIQKWPNDTQESIMEIMTVQIISWAT